MAKRYSPSAKEEIPLPIAVRRGPKPRKTKISPGWKAEVQLFQKTFSPYFGHLADDLDTTGFEMSWLYTRVVGNPFDSVRRTKAKLEMAKIAAALKLMGKHDMPYWQRLNWVIYEAKESGDELAIGMDEILKFMLTLSGMDEDGRLEKIIRRIYSSALKAIDDTPERGNIHWKAVHAVEGLRILWWRNTGNEGPERALNPASKFANYLRDGFQFLEIKANPESAFRRWVAAYPKYDRS